MEFETPDEAVKRAMSEEWDAGDWIATLAVIVVGCVLIGFLKAKFGA